MLLLKKNNNNKIAVIILVILLVGALGFICYDKFINKERPPVPTPTASLEPTNNNTSLTTLNKVKLTLENQSITIGNKTFNVRISDESNKNLYINDVLVSEEFYADTVYATDSFAFFTAYG